MDKNLPANNNTLVLHPYLKSEKSKDLDASLEEAVGLALAIDLEVLHQEVVPLSKTIPASFIGSGKVDEYKSLITEKEIGLVIIDNKLSPVQQRNLEKAWNCKVIDRTALILEIFGARARTREGKLQVELAALEYQKSRLVRSWTHLERQRGGLGFIGGPGETQIESDRRLISEKIVKIKAELETVKRTRTLHRKARNRVPYPIVALVGYTNAGKSTLFNYLTGSKVYAEDKLFATLDPTMRVVTLPSKKKIILSDTVGFISNLPTELIAAFRATLEEVIEADLILHVRDISSPLTENQKNDVNKVLTSLNLDYEISFNTTEVLNKIDLLSEEEQFGLNSRYENNPDVICISAISGMNCDQLLKQIDVKLSKDDEIIEINCEATEGKIIAWIYENSEVLDKEENNDTLLFKLRINSKNKAKLYKFIKK
jgi:GTP-binding protein HflX